MLSPLSTIGFLIDGGTFLFIAFRLYKPTRDSVGFNPQSFRGSLFWYFFIFSFFPILLGITLLGDDIKTAGLYGYVIGHIFLYAAYALYIFAPFSIIAPERKKIPLFLSLLIFVSGLVITVINWRAYASDEYVPVVGANDVIVWNPPVVVSAFIIGISLIILGVFGAGLFFWHAYTTPNPFLRKRSFLLGLGFLILLMTGPPHDVPDISPIIILFADIFAAVGALIQGYALSLRQET